MELRARNAAACLSALRGAYAVQRLVGTYQTIIAVLTGPGYWLAQWGAHQFMTWLPKIEVALTVLEVGMGFLEHASQSLHDTADSLDGLSTAERGRRIEQIAGANLGGNVSGIDDIRFADEDSAFVTSVRSHDVKSPEALLRAIRNDANELYDKSSRTMRGPTSSGRLVAIDPDIVKGRALLVAIPSNRAVWLRSFTQTLRQIADSTETVVRVVPVRGWRSKK
jgi:hypothetical protein